MNILQLVLVIIIVTVSGLGIFLIQWKHYQDSLLVGEVVPPVKNNFIPPVKSNVIPPVVNNVINNDGQKSNKGESVNVPPVNVVVPHTSRPIIDPISDGPVRIMSVAQMAFAEHPAHFIPATMQLDEYMALLSKQPQCLNKPIFITMARVQSNLYWQLIEGFFHSMFAFGHLPCAVMVCVTDPVCMQRCEDMQFPCYNYIHPNASKTHVMEQVAHIKLFHTGQALAMGVNVFLLDMDVGFFRDPMALWDSFAADKTEHFRSQMDVASMMNKSLGNTWFTAPGPNFGLFMVKADKLTVKTFAQANKMYRKVNPDKRSKVASDQSVISGAMKWARWRFGLNFSYFSLGYLLDTSPRPIHPQKALLLHKMDRVSNNGILFELGGRIAKAEFRDAIAGHATCYEKSTKLMALKAGNLYWNFKYYDPMRRTLTKPLMMLSRRQLRQEIISLAYLAVATNRTLILPNPLIGVGIGILGQLKSKNRCLATQRLGSKVTSSYCTEAFSKRNSLAGLNNTHAFPNRGEYYWPGFRLVDDTFYVDNRLTIVEPSYYYRTQESQRDYLNFHKSNRQYGAHAVVEDVVPEPYIHRFDVHSADFDHDTKSHPPHRKLQAQAPYPNNKPRRNKQGHPIYGWLLEEQHDDTISKRQKINLEEDRTLDSLLTEIQHIDEPRLVLDVYDSQLSAVYADMDQNGAKEDGTNGISRRLWEVPVKEKTEVEELEVDSLVEDHHEPVKFSDHAVEGIEDTIRGGLPVVDVGDVITAEDGSHIEVKIEKLNNVDEIHMDYPEGGHPHNLIEWAKDSASSWGQSPIEKGGYVPLPRVDAKTSLQRSPPASADFGAKLRMCKSLMQPVYGNRSCFDKCS